MKNIVRELRAAQGWSQDDLASRIKVSRQAIEAIETDRHDPSLPLAMSIARVFQKPIEIVFLEGDIAVWGRSLREYRLMFSLSDQELGQRMLGCGDGPASVNAELKALGFSGYTSIDPIYALPVKEIEFQVRKANDSIISRMKQAEDSFLWNHFSGPDALSRERIETMNRFLQDYEPGRAERRYVAGSLPELPFPDGAFDLCLCSHLLFFYSTQLSYDFHLTAVLEQLRVAREVRVFPVLDFDFQYSPHLEPVMKVLRERGYNCTLVKVAHEFQKGANEMLQVRPK